MADSGEESSNEATVVEENGAAEQSDGELNPEIDLLNRYTNMLETQMQSINEIDNKASDTARLIGIIFGLILTTVSIAATTDLLSLSDASIPFFVMLGLSMVALLVALLLSFVTYLSSTVIHGPTASIGGYLADYRVESQQYTDIMLRTYSRAVKENKQVIFGNANRFKNTLAVLILGIIYLVATGILLVATVLEIGVTIQWIVVVLFSFIGLAVAYGVGVKEYITIEAEHLVKNDEQDEK